MALAAPVPLDKHHHTVDFDCGKLPLNLFLQKHALNNQLGGGARTYVVLDGERVAGYYSLAPAAVQPVDAPARVMKGQAQHPVPCILLARLAVDLSAQGSGLGRSLLRDALLRAYNAHAQIGGRAFLVYALDDEARAFYSRYSMMPSPTDPLHVFLLFKDIHTLLMSGSGP